MRKRKHIGFLLSFVMIVMPLAWVLADYFSFLTAFEHTTLNWRYSLRGEIDAPVNLIYVDIDSKALEFMGERPIPRTFFADAIGGLFKYGGAKTIGLDAMFLDNAYSSLVDVDKAIKDTSNLREIIEEYPQLVMAAQMLNHGKNIEGPEKQLIGKNGVTIGLINIDEDFPHAGTTNWVPLFEGVANKIYYTMALELVRIFYDVPREAVSITKGEATLYRSNGSILLRIPLADGKFVEVNWFSKWMSSKNEHFSLKDAIEAGSWVKSGNQDEKTKAEQFYKLFHNAIVLIGEVDPLLNNLAPTPFDEDPVPKIGIHGNLVETLISKKFLKRPAFGLNIIILFALTLMLVYPIAWLGKKGRLLKIVGVGILPLYLVATVYLFKQFNLVLPIIGPVGSAVSTSFFVLLIQLINTEKQRSRIRDMFGTYISPKLVSDMIEEDVDPQLGGQETIITAFFSDIENFSTISESLSPSALIELMNEYLSEMTAIIQEEKGTLDKYVGDSIVSMFGAPVPIEKHALAACRAACRMQQKQLELCEKWRRDYRKWPESVLAMRTRCGISTGLAIIGNMGSEIRFNYTMLGDNVNLASRCESMGKTYGVYCVATSTTVKEAERKDGIAFRFLDRILFHGKTESVEIYEVLGFKNDLSEKTRKCIEIYTEGLNDFFSEDWDNAIKNFEKSAFLEPGDGVGLTPSKMFLKKCRELKLQS